MNRPQTNRKGNKNKSLPMDRCQTPGYALDPLLPYLPGRIWESAAGSGLMAARLRREGLQVVESDILAGQNFFEFEPDSWLWQAQVTNPPYSCKYDWIARSYQLGKPFALLMPFYTWAARRANCLFEQYGIEVIIMNPRVNFIMPNKGTSGAGAQFSSAWFTWGLNIGAPVSYATLTYYDDRQLPLI